MLSFQEQGCCLGILVAGRCNENTGGANEGKQLDPKSKMVPNILQTSITKSHIFHPRKVLVIKSQKNPEYWSLNPQQTSLPITSRTNHLSLPAILGVGVFGVTSLNDSPP